MSENGLLFKGPKFLRLLENYGNTKLPVVESDNMAYLEKSTGECSVEINRNNFHKELHEPYVLRFIYTYIKAAD